MIIFFLSFKKGQKTCGVLDAIKKHPDIWIEAFCSRPSAALTASNVNLMFKIEDRAPEGSNKYAKEKTVETYWRDFLEDLDGNNNICNLHETSF